jgi:hypothetical protein
MVIITLPLGLSDGGTLLFQTFREPFGEDAIVAEMLVDLCEIVSEAACPSSSYLSLRPILSHRGGSSMPRSGSSRNSGSGGHAARRLVYEGLQSRVSEAWIRRHQSSSGGDNYSGDVDGVSFNHLNSLLNGGTVNGGGSSSSSSSSSGGSKAWGRLGYTPTEVCSHNPPSSSFAPSLAEDHNSCRFANHVL